MTYAIRGVSVAVFKAGRILLVRRVRDPYRGCWSLPGGRIEAGETEEMAARRELAEETALTARELTFVTRHEPGGSIRLSVFACTRFEGAPRAGDDADAVAWHHENDLGALYTTPGLAAIIRKARRIADTQN